MIEFEVFHLHSRGLDGNNYELKAGSTMTFQILCVVLIVMVVAVLFVSFKSRRVVTISRSLLIGAPVDQLFPYINEPRRIQEWNPFIEGDSTTKMSFSGPPAGEGAQWDWEGKKAGAGRATIVETEMNRRVALLLEFRKPFKATNHGEYALKQLGESTLVTWTVDESAFIPRFIHLFVSMDRIIGPLFTKGLTKLKTLAETKAAATV